MIETIEFQSQQSQELINITEQVKEIVDNVDIDEGVCIVYSQHTTAGVLLNTASDPATAKDILDEFDNLVPIRATFKHTLDTPADAAGHIKLALVGNSVHLPVIDGKLSMGGSQSILFFDFDGPRDRKVVVQILG